MKTHIYHSRASIPLDGFSSRRVWNAQCGRVLENDVQAETPDAATCGHCLLARRNRALRLAQSESALANMLTQRLELARKRRARQGATQ